ncbi:MAG: ATP-dependent helicase HrpB [Myxococcota bacterium]
MSARVELPIDAVLGEVVRAACDGGVVLVAPPGAGKTTRVPPALLEAVRGEVWVVQPRRVAARAAARRMAAERGEPVGRTVGHQVRFDRVGGADTRIWVVTEGILLRRLQADPLLDGIAAVLLDEVHERSLDGDLLLALLREVREVRPELVVGAMSATVAPGPFAAFLGDVPVVTASGRTFPVETSYLRLPDARPVDALVADGVRQALAEGDGDVLAFLPGVRDILRAQDRLAGLGVDVVPLYGELPPDAQDRALLPGGRRRVVLATNVAETSVTVPGIRAVVDGGLVRRPRQDPATGLDRLDTVAISRASAEQRAGRAGRTGPGRALRLWTEREHLAREPFDPPEVLRVDLAGPVLQILAWGSDPQRFGWFEAPPPEAVDAALGVLAALGAVDARGLTATGRALAGLPLHPRLGRLLLAGAEAGVRDDAALAAALLGERDRAEPARGASRSDVADRIDAVRAGRWPEGPRQAVLRVAGQLQRLVPGGGRGDADALGKAVLAAWPDRVVRRRAPDSDRGRMVGGRGVRLDRSSAVTVDELFVAVSVADEPGEPDARVRIASAVERGWLAEDVVHEVAYDADADAVRGRRVHRYRDLVLASHPAPADDADVARCLAAVVAADPDRALPTEGPLPGLRARLRFLAARDGDRWALDWRALAEGLCGAQRSLAALRRADWVGAVRDALGWAAWQELQRRAPERVTVPSGRAVALDWGEDPPVLAVRMQELFGARDTPTVDDGRVRVKLHLLAPNGRPQQITDDLGGFWTRTWPEVRKELRARYPKHAWPEDPLRASPQARPGRRPG